MAAKVILDAGHGGAEPGAVFDGRQEKDDNLRLALAVGELLTQNGVDVAYTRTEDVYDTPYEKAQIANREGGDFLISFHRNSSPEPDQYSGVESLVYNLNGQKMELAENINEALEQVGFRNLGVKERPDLVILRRSQMPAVLVETGFLNTQEDNARFDEDFDAIAQAITDGILVTLGQDTVQAQEKLYRVQTGAFRRREYAEDQLYQLLEQNFPAFLLYEDGYYKVQVGAFRQLDNAVRMEQALRKKGYATFITT
jgi:N-acetylmuramoyl-L-alanine amidase